jgi:hypothetical protein
MWREVDSKIVGGEMHSKIGGDFRKDLKKGTTWYKMTAICEG